MYWRSPLSYVSYVSIGLASILFYKLSISILIFEKSPVYLMKGLAGLFNAEGREIGLQQGSEAAEFPE